MYIITLILFQCQMKLHWVTIKTDNMKQVVTKNNFAIKQSLSTNNSQATSITLGVTPAPKVDKDEYLMDMRQDALPVMIISSSCKKETSFLALPNQIVAQQLPTIRVDKYFPNGVLQFKTPPLLN